MVITFLRAAVLDALQVTPKGGPCPERLQFRPNVRSYPLSPAKSVQILDSAPPERLVNCARRSLHTRGGEGQVLVSSHQTGRLGTGTIFIRGHWPPKGPAGLGLWSTMFPPINTWGNPSVKVV